MQAQCRKRKPTGHQVQATDMAPFMSHNIGALIFRKIGRQIDSRPENPCRKRRVDVIQQVHISLHFPGIAQFPAEPEIVSNSKSVQASCPGKPDHGQNLHPGNGMMENSFCF